MFGKVTLVIIHGMGDNIPRWDNIPRCTICREACSQSGHLTVHTRSHSSDRPYACTTCGQAFATPRSLTSHMRTHSGDRPYVCTTCGQTYSQSSDLTKHTRTLTGHLLGVQQPEKALRESARGRSGVMALDVQLARVVNCT